MSLAFSSIRHISISKHFSLLLRRIVFSISLSTRRTTSVRLGLRKQREISLGSIKWVYPVRLRELPGPFRFTPLFERLLEVRCMISPGPFGTHTRSVHDSHQVRSSNFIKKAPHKLCCEMHNTLNYKKVFKFIQKPMDSPVLLLFPHGQLPYESLVPQEPVFRRKHCVCVDARYVYGRLFRRGPH